MPHTKRAARRAHPVGAPVSGSIERAVPDLRLCVLLLALALTGLLHVAPASADDTCPNAEFRTGASAGLPDCRAYELVSPADGKAYSVSAPMNIPPRATGARLSTADGDMVTYLIGINGTLSGMAVDGDAPDIFVGARGDGGWGWKAPVSDRTACAVGPNLLDLSVDAGSLLLAVPCSADTALLSKDPVTGVVLDQSPSGSGSAGPVYRVDVASDVPTFLDGKADAVGPVPRTCICVGDFYLGGTSDLSTVYFATAAGLLPGVADGGLSYVYRRTSAGTTLITKNSTGTPLPVTTTLPVPPLDRPNAVGRTAEGSVFTLTTSYDPSTQSMLPVDTNTVNDVYQVGAAGIVWISQTAYTGSVQTPAGRNFEGGAVDGKRVYFSTIERMVGDDTAGDVNAVNDIYEYDANASAGHELSLVSTPDPSCASLSVPPPAGQVACTASAATAAANFSTVSGDGSHVFFTTTSILDPHDIDAQASLYVRDVVQGTTTYVASAGNAADSGTATNGSLAQTGNISQFKARPIRLSADGRTAAFMLTTRNDLPAGSGGTDDASARDLFVWREGTGLRRVRQGVGPDVSTSTVPVMGCATVTNGGASASCRTLTGDGTTVYFQTANSLVAGDINTVVDVYSYDVATGEVSLISPAGSTAASTYVDNSADGSDVFFLNSDTLDPSRDLDGGLPDLYDARVDGGFAPPAPDDPGCDPIAAGGCQGSGSAPPVFSGGGSDALAGDGNLVAGTRSTISGIRKLSSSDRSTLARGGRARLRLKVNRSGTVSVAGTAKIGKKSRLVISSRAKARKAGLVSIPLALSKRARSQLRRKKSLTVALTVRFTDARPKAVTLTLKSVTSKKGGRS